MRTHLQISMTVFLRMSFVPFFITSSMRSLITNLAKRIEDVEQRHPEPRPEDDYDDFSEEEDGDAEAEAEAQRRAKDARNCNRLNFNRRGMGGNN